MLIWMFLTTGCWKQVFSIRVNKHKLITVLGLPQLGPAKIEALKASLITNLFSSLFRILVPERRSHCEWTRRGSTCTGLTKTTRWICWTWVWCETCGRGHLPKSLGWVRAADVCVCLLFNMQSIFIYVVGHETAANRDDGLPGYARGEDDHRLLCQRFRECDVSKFLLHQEGDCAGKWW